MHVEAMRDARSLSNGARFYRCALQVNPTAYAGGYRGEDHGLDEAGYWRAIFEKCRELAIEVVAVTDHQSVSAVDAARAEGTRQGIHVFPGFEIESKEGVQVLCIYPEKTERAALDSFLGEAGKREPLSFGNLLECIRKQGGISIAAHATNAKGLFKTMKGQARIRAWRDPNLLAIQIPGPLRDLPDEIRPIVRNENADYRREPEIAEQLAVAVVNAKDVARPEDLADPASSSYLKMTEVSIEGLRQAFLDPESRIRLPSQAPQEGHIEFLAMTWLGGFLDAEAIHFNAGLNVLVGGRGAGKSTVIESIRYVLGIEPLGSEAKKSHESIVRQVLKGGTKVSLLVRCHRPAPEEYLIERTVPNPPVVRKPGGDVLPLRPADVVQAEVFGQHELSELARSEEKRTRLLDRFVRHDATLEGRIAELRREIERSRTRILEVSRELGQVEERLGSLPALEETLRRFAETGLEERLRERSLLVREEQVFKIAEGRVSPVRDLARSLREAVPIDRAFASAKALEGLPGRELLVGVAGTLTRLEERLRLISADLEAALGEAQAGLATTREEWEGHRQRVQHAYEETLRELQRSKVDGDEFIRLRERVEELRPLKERKDLLERERKVLLAQRQQLLAEWSDARTLKFAELKKAASRVSKGLQGRVRVTVVHEGDRTALLESVKTLGGRLAETERILRGCESLSVVDLVGACRSGKESLVEKYGLPSPQADRLARAPEALLLQMEELDLAPTSRIELDVAADGAPSDYRQLEDLSTGQKATALLLLLLLDGDSPLVVDQPEDDLDNRFITEGVVPALRRAKAERQFLFSTHNANLPVLGDAELILGLEPSSEGGEGRGRIPPEHRGSIDLASVQDLVKTVLEGGRAAFEKRRLKYGF